MKIYKSTLIFSLLLLLLSVFDQSVFAARREVSKSAREHAKRYRFTIVENLRLRGNIKGENIPIELMNQELVRFFKALDELGIDFVKKSGLKRVMICRNLSLRGMPCSGIATGNTIYLNVGFPMKTVYHEIYHLFDSKKEDKSWTRLNHKRFKYRSIDFPERRIRKSKKRDLKEHYQKYDHIDFSKDFISDYAQSEPREDRAETFAFMVAMGKNFTVRAQKSPVLWNKMQYIIDSTGKKSLLGKNYWVKKLGRVVLHKTPPQMRRTKRN